MTFQDWWKDNAVELNDLYLKSDMEWIAEFSPGCSGNRIERFNPKGE